MKINTGVDMVEVERIKKSLKQERFLNRILTRQEMEYVGNIKNKYQSIASMFCAKEACAKALGTGISGFCFKDIEVCHDKRGKPFLNLHGEPRKTAIKSKLKFDLSITHTALYAAAFVVAYTDGEG
jgi:holo-[acyl-carrier protein] synthase